MNDGKIYKVIIFGQEYSIATDESEEQVRKVADTVDKLMCTIAGKSALRDGNRVAVLAALRLASEVFNLEKQLCERNIDEKRLMELVDHILVSSITTG